MADNYSTPAGSGGETFASDDVLGVQYPRVKIVDGTPDASTNVAAGNGLAANALRVTVASDSTGVLGASQSGTWTVQPGNTANTTAWLVTGTGGTFPVTDSGGSLTVDNAALSVVGGGLEATALRVTLANNSTGLVSVDDNGGSLTVDGSVSLAAAIPAGTNNIGDVDIVTMPNVTLAAGTNTNEVVGDAAHDAAIAGNPVRIGARGLSADYTAVATGDTADIIASLLGKQINLPFALPGNTWNYAAVAGGLVNTTGVSARAAQGVGIRNYVTAAQVINSHATISTEVLIRDGAAGTVLHRGWAQAAGGGYACTFEPPLRGTANTLIEIAEVTATATAGVLVNLQGFSAAE